MAYQALARKLARGASVLGLLQDAWYGVIHVDSLGQQVARNSSELPSAFASHERQSPSTARLLLSGADWMRFCEALGPGTATSPSSEHTTRRLVNPDAKWWTAMVDGPPSSCRGLNSGRSHYSTVLGFHCRIELLARMSPSCSHCPVWSLRTVCDFSFSRSQLVTHTAKPHCSEAVRFTCSMLRLGRPTSGSFDLLTAVRNREIK